jgi:hypothetical protein
VGVGLVSPIPTKDSGSIGDFLSGAGLSADLRARLTEALKDAEIASPSDVLEHWDAFLETRPTFLTGIALKKFNKFVATERELEQRASQGNAFCEQNRNSPHKYLVDGPWFELWVAYIQAGTPPPGKIDNSALLLEGPGGPLKKVIPGAHCYRLSQAAWINLLELCGGGPELTHIECQRCNLLHSDGPGSNYCVECGEALPQYQMG